MLVMLADGEEVVVSYDGMVEVTVSVSEKPPIVLSVTVGGGERETKEILCEVVEE